MGMAMDMNTSMATGDMNMGTAMATGMGMDTTAMVVLVRLWRMKLKLARIR